MTDKEQGPAGIVDMLAHWYPEGCVREMIGDQPEFDLVASPGGDIDSRGVVVWSCLYHLLLTWWQHSQVTMQCLGRLF
ncbi:MAG: hypothetical protein O6837_01580 [Deltaproteobacteria bacterium]|nr:hypothetical protein [Deltaproteobacteria bacterium]